MPPFSALPIICAPSCRKNKASSRENTEGLALKKVKKRHPIGFTFSWSRTEIRQLPCEVLLAVLIDASNSLRIVPHWLYNGAAVIGLSISDFTSSASQYSVS